MTEPRKPAFYVRVSRAAQDYPSQLHALAEFMRRSRWPVPKKDRIYCEKITGKRARRTHLDRLLQACRDGLVDTIVCYRADRMGNDAVHMHNLIAELDRLKIRLVGVSDSVDTGTQTAATNLFRNMLIAFAQGQREVTVERTLAGLRAARAKGRVGGRPPRDPAKSQRILKLREAGKSLSEIAAELGFSRGYVSLVCNRKRLGVPNGGKAQK